MQKTIRVMSSILILVLMFGLFSPGVLAVLGDRSIGVSTGKKAVSISNVSVPGYDGGSASSWMNYDCGAGVCLTDTSVESKMRIISGTNKTEFNAYITKLQDQGYTKIFARKITGVTKENIFGKFLSADGSHSVYIALFPYLNQVRIVVDNNKSTVGRYKYTPVGTGRTELYLYSLSQPHDGWGTGSDEALITQYRSGAGSMLFMKMSDNSLYIIDGGSSNQMGDRACMELYDFLRSVTGVPEGQKMTINTWHISHPHSDHVTGFTRFISKYHKEFDLLTVLYNFDIESTSRSYLQTVARLYPEVGYYKPHTGDQYTVSGITFDVLYTTEDRYQPNSSNKLIMGDASCIAYTHENNTSMVVQVQMDGKKVLLTGDLQKADATLMSMYPASVLQSDVFQIPHHGIDNHTELAKTVAPAIGFTNQSKKAVMSRERYYTNNSGWYPYIGKIYYAGTETVGYAADSGVFYRKAFEGYDYLKWSDNVYDLGKANPQTGDNPVKDPETYYRYTQATGIKTSNWPYIIVDDKLGRVLSYDAIGDGGVTDALPAFYDGTHYYFSDSQRRLVNWLIKYTTAGTKSDAAVSSAETTYYEKVMIKKWHDDYWGTPTKNHAIIIGKDDTFTSEGMFDTWASFSQQVDTTSNSTWIDKLSDNTFVIYRNNNGTYYPLYRDGNIAAERGWGTSKLTQSKISTMHKYVKTRLYSYETTPSNMLLSWTGHKDYYVETGISEKDLINLLISDIRVTYSFDAFDGTGEIFHTSQNKKDAGTYWFTYSPAYTPSVAQDYTVTINYRSAKGTVLSVGNFTLHVADVPVKDPGLKIGHTLNLASDISVNFAVAKTLLEGYELSTVYMECTLPTYEGNIQRGETSVKLSPEDKGEYYYFTLTGLTAIHMNDPIRSVLYGTKNGQAYYSGTDEYSIGTYAYSQLNKSGVKASLKTLCADLLRYGALAQTYKGYRTDTLADATMTDEHRAYLSPIDSVTFGSTNGVLNDTATPTVTWAGKALDLGSKVSLKFIVCLTEYKGAIEALTLQLSYLGIDGEQKAAVLPYPEVYNPEKDYYAFSFDGLLAAELRTVVSARVYMGDTPVSETLQYSADTYGNNKKGVLLDLCKALFAYSDSAKAYFNS